MEKSISDVLRTASLVGMVIPYGPDRYAFSILMSTMNKIVLIYYIHYDYT